MRRSLATALLLLAQINGVQAWSCAADGAQAGFSPGSLCTAYSDKGNVARYSPMDSHGTDGLLASWLEHAPTLFSPRVISAGLATLCVMPSRMHPQIFKASRLVVPLLFGARADAFALPDEGEPVSVEEADSQRRLQAGCDGSCDDSCDGCNDSCDNCNLYWAYSNFVWISDCQALNSPAFSCDSGCDYYCDSSCDDSCDNSPPPPSPPPP